MVSEILAKSKQQLKRAANAIDKTCSKPEDNRHVKRKGHSISEWERKILMLPVNIDILEMHLCRGVVTKVKGVINNGEVMSTHYWDRRGQCWRSKFRTPEFDISFES